MMIGDFPFSSAICLILFMASTPSISGIMWSMNTISYSPASYLSIASLPLSAVSANILYSRSRPVATTRFIGSSSTTSADTPVNRILPFVSFPSSYPSFSPFNILTTGNPYRGLGSTVTLPVSDNSCSGDAYNTTLCPSFAKLSITLISDSYSSCPVKMWVTFTSLTSRVRSSAVSTEYSLILIPVARLTAMVL